MKRRIAAAVLAVLILALTATVALAATDSGQDYFDWMFNAHRQWVQQAVDSKEITPEQAQAWNSHIDQMQQFHQQNGFACPGPAMMGGSGWGMMGGYRGSN